MTVRSAEATNSTKWSLALSLLIGPLAWSVFHIAGYLTAEAACAAGLLQSNVAGLNLVVVVVLALGLLATLVTGWGALWSYRRWRAAEEESEETEALLPFLAATATVLSLIFLLANIVTALGMLFIVPCQWT